MPQAGSGPQRVLRSLQEGEEAAEADGLHPAVHQRPAMGGLHQQSGRHGEDGATSVQVLTSGEGAQVQVLL